MKNMSLILRSWENLWCNGKSKHLRTRILKDERSISHREVRTNCSYIAGLASPRTSWLGTSVCLRLVLIPSKEQERNSDKQIGGARNLVVLPMVFGLLYSRGQ